jgi:hypothetical protein
LSPAPRIKIKGLILLILPNSERLITATTTFARLRFTKKWLFYVNFYSVVGVECVSVR